MADWFESFKPNRAKEVIDGSVQSTDPMVNWCYTPEGDTFWYRLHEGDVSLSASVITRICEMVREHRTWKTKGESL